MTYIQRVGIDLLKFGHWMKWLTLKHCKIHSRKKKHLIKQRTNSSFPCLVTVISRQLRALMPWPENGPLRPVVATVAFEFGKLSKSLNWYTTVIEEALKQ